MSANLVDIAGPNQSWNAPKSLLGPVTDAIVGLEMAEIRIAVRVPCRCQDQIRDT
jgi:hypothetical protein